MMLKVPRCNMNHQILRTRFPCTIYIRFGLQRTHAPNSVPHRGYGEGQPASPGFIPRRGKLAQQAGVPPPTEPASHEQVPALLTSQGQVGPRALLHGPCMESLRNSGSFRNPNAGIGD